jgi:hypothetical protein
MPIFHLTPVLAKLDHADWATSTFRGEAWVNAESADAARGIASGKFQDGGASLPGHGSAPSPWRAAELVEVQEVQDTPNGMVIPENTIVAGD